MPALSEHLRDPEGHARLAFHPGCPICRGERLSGTLPTQAVISQRTRAALTAGVVVVATVAPAAAVGADTAASAGGDRALSADLTPGANAAATGTAVDTRPDATTDDDDAAGDDSTADHGGTSDGATVVAGDGTDTHGGGDQSAAAPARPTAPPAARTLTAQASRPHAASCRDAITPFWSQATSATR